MRRTLSASIASVAFVALGPPAAEAQGLTGTYAFTGVRTCVVSTKPFKKDKSGAPTVIGGEVSRLTAVDAGDFIFHADGTGSQTGRGDQIDLTETRVGFSISNLVAFSTPFTYVVHPNGKLVVSLAAGTLTVLLGAEAGDKGTTSPRTDVFQLVEDGQAFTTAPKTTIAQETVQFHTPVAFVEYRLCTRSGFRGKISR
jgi:hypothetical protein